VPVLGSFGVTGWHDEARARGPGVTVGRSGASFGAVSYSSIDYWPLNTALYVTDFHGNDPRFAYYFLKGFNFKSYNSGSAQPSLNRNFVHPVPVHVPSLQEQRAIGHILGAFDDKIELNRRMSETLEAMARALFQSWFVDFDPVRAKVEGRDPGVPKHIANLFPARLVDSELGEMPEGWRIGSILEQARLLSGGTPKTDVQDYWDGDISWASAKDVSQCRGMFLVATERSITARGLGESATQVIPAFSTVVVARGATTGRMTMLGRDMAMNQTCYGLATLTRTPFTLYCRMRHEIDALVHSAHGSVFDTITTSTFSTSKIAIVPPALSEAFEERVAPKLQRALQCALESRTLESLRDTLLPKLISGELRVNEAQTLVQAA
jgi:type I restriction enzyme S subunit